MLYLDQSLSTIVLEMQTVTFVMYWRLILFLFIKLYWASIANSFLMLILGFLEQRVGCEIRWAIYINWFMFFAY